MRSSDLRRLNRRANTVLDQQSQLRDRYEHLLEDYSALTGAFQSEEKITCLMQVLMLERIAIALETIANRKDDAD